MFRAAVRLPAYTCPGAAQPLSPRLSDSLNMSIRWMEHRRFVTDHCSRSLTLGDEDHTEQTEGHDFIRSVYLQRSAFNSSDIVGYRRYVECHL